MISDLIAKLAVAEFAELDALNRLARATALFRPAPEWRATPTAMIHMSRHRWSEPERDDPQCTVRICANCGMPQADASQDHGRGPRMGGAVLRFVRWSGLSRRRHATLPRRSP
jgi:hypothetical protein